MSELRIRSEAVPDAVWPQPFAPRPAEVAGDDAAEDGDFGPFLGAAARALTALFGFPAEVQPGRPPKALPGDKVPRVAGELAGLLATVQLGGVPARRAGDDPERAIGGAPARRVSDRAGVVKEGGVIIVRHARAIADTLDAVAERVWPMGCRRAGIDLDIACGGIAGHAHVPAPEQPAPVVPEPVAALAARVLDMPMRLRVELASEMVLVATLLPLCTGRVLAIDPSPEMPLILGDHRIGRATVAPLPDGRQRATIVAIDVEAIGERP